MRKIKRIDTGIALFVALIIVFFFLLQKSYPLLGQDYFYFFPRILAGKWHVFHAGLTPFRYIPHLCGGLPLYGNPQDIFYSMPQLLGSMMDLWFAMQVSIFLMLIAGWAGWYRFGRDVVGLSATFAALLALIILANGYYLLHMLIGHVTFQATPLIGWFVWFLFDPAQLSPRRLAFRTAAFALLCAIVLYGGGYFVLIQACMLSLFLLPFLLVRQGMPPLAQVKNAALRFTAYGAAALVVCASKLVAVYSLMRFFPRLTDFSHFTAQPNIFGFIARVFWQAPQHHLLLDADPYPSALHEYGMYVSPVVIVGLVAAGCIFAREWRRRSWVRSLVVLCAVAALGVFFAQVTRGSGPVAEWFHGLPAISSLRINTRFLYLAALLLSMAGVWGFYKAVVWRGWQRWSVHIVLASGGITLIGLAAAYVPAITPEFMDLSMPYDIVNKAIGENPHFLNQSVTMVEDLRANQVSDFQYVLAGTTGVSCYEPVLAGADLLPALQAGPTTLVRDGAYNMNHPACLQYPESNACLPGARIPVTNADQFSAFVGGQNPGWNLSVPQRVADAASALGLLLALGFVAWSVWPRAKEAVVGVRKRFTA